MINIYTQCPKCKATINKLTPHCNFCGKPVLPQLTMDNIKMCTVCGMLSESNASSCSKCGRQLPVSASPLPAANDGFPQSGYDTTPNFSAPSQSSAPAYSSTPANSTMASGKVKIYGYTGWYAVKPSIDIFVNGSRIGGVGYKEVFEYTVTTDTTFTFKNMFRTVTASVQASRNSNIRLEFNRISGQLTATVE